MKCIICGKEKEENEFSKEHIIPEALGNTALVTFRICRECNNRLGTKVDNSFTDHNIIKAIRQQLDLRGKKNKPVKLFQGTMKGDDGRLYDFHKGKCQIHPTISQTPEGLKVEAEDQDASLDLLAKKLQREGKSTKDLDKKIRVEKQKISAPTFILNADVDTGKLVCFFTKIAYEYTSLILGDEYFDDPIASLFRKDLFETAYNGRQEHEEIKPYLSFQSDSVDLMHQVKALNNDGLKIRHAIVLHPDGQNHIICHIFLFLQDGLSFCVCMSENADKYSFHNSAIVLINEDGKTINL